MSEQGVNENQYAEKNKREQAEVQSDKRKVHLEQIEGNLL